VIHLLTRRDAAFLYQFAGPAGALNDITIGNNPGYGCDNGSVGFNAQKGWDPTSGVSSRIRSLTSVLIIVCRLRHPELPQASACGGHQEPFLKCTMCCMCRPADEGNDDLPDVATAAVHLFPPQLTVVFPHA
jgi:hypothetical protein